MNIFEKNPGKKRLVLIGGGFGGIEFAKRVDTSNMEVLVLDKHNYFTFQPLLYQVATGGLEPDSVAYPLRKILSRNEKVIFRVGEVTDVDTNAKLITSDIGLIPYDILVLASGSATNFFHMDELQKNALSLKSVPDALNIRSFILQNFEKALLCKTREEQKRLMNFVIVGGGPTGVEVSGAIAELKRHALPNDYPELDLSMMEITILESGENVLGVMSDYAKRTGLEQLKELGVKVIFKHQLTGYDGKAAKLEDGTTIETSALIWTAGVMGNFPKGFSPDIIVKGNRLAVDDYNRVKGFKDVYAIGDVCAMESGPHPMLAPVAVQQATNLVKNLSKSDEQRWKKFKYKDRGTMATIGRSRAVADLKVMHLQGFLAWLAWLFIHLILLVGFRNKIIVLFNWFWNYFSYDRAIRLIIRPYRK